MKMTLLHVLLAGLAAMVLATWATAGSVVDADADGVPDGFDNCIPPDPGEDTSANGPNEAPRDQLDRDLDGYGNWCDADYDESGVVDGGDFSFFITTWNTVDRETDHNGDRITTGADFGRFVALFNTAPGPSGLSCAGTAPCTP